MTRQMLRQFITAAHAKGLIGINIAKRLRGAIERGDLSLDLSWIRPTRMPTQAELKRGHKRRHAEEPAA